MQTIAEEWSYDTYLKNMLQKTTDDEPLAQYVESIGRSADPCEPRASDDERRSAESALKRMVGFARESRFAAFSKRCRKLQRPLNAGPHGHNQPLHDMVFTPSDCFKELSYILPGSHGWIFVFREELKNWLLGAIDSFNVAYQDEAGSRTFYGSYEAFSFNEYKMTGPEFACLPELARLIIITHVMHERKRTELGYDAMESAFLASHQTISCIFLQCRAMPPQNYGFNGSLASCLSTKYVASAPVFQKAVSEAAQPHGLLAGPPNPSVEHDYSLGTLGQNATFPPPNSKYDTPAVPTTQDNISRLRAALNNLPAELKSSTDLRGLTPNLTKTYPAGITSLAHMVPVPDIMRVSDVRYKEGDFHHRPVNSPAAKKNTSNDQNQNQNQYTHAHSAVPPRFSASTLRVSTNTRGAAPLGYGQNTSQHIQQPSFQAPPNNCRAQMQNKFHNNYSDQNQNFGSTWAPNRDVALLNAPGGVPQADYQRQLGELYSDPWKVVLPPHLRPSAPFPQRQGPYNAQAPQLPEGHARAGPTILPRARALTNFVLGL